MEQLNKSRFCTLGKKWPRIRETEVHCCRKEKDKRMAVQHLRQEMRAIKSKNQVSG